MKEIIFAIAVIVLLCVAVEVLKKNKKFYKIGILFVSVLYLGGLIYFTQLRGNRVNISGISIKFPLPFAKAIINRRFGLVAKRSLLNLLLFVPFGYLLPNVVVSFGKRVTWWQIMVFGFVTSLIIETCQLFFHRGVYELDDLVKNTLGAVIGFVLFTIFDRIISQKTNT